MDLAMQWWAFHAPASLCLAMFWIFLCAWTSVFFCAIPPFLCSPGAVYLHMQSDHIPICSSLVLSGLDYCNALLAGSQKVLLDKIQRVINCSARLIYQASKSAHITPLLFDFHWLPISSWIQYKIALTCFHIISGTAPPYLFELLHLYSPSPSLRSASDTQIFRVPRVCRGTLGERSFQYIGPVIWNSLSFSVRHAMSLSSFKSKLKTHLFSSAY